MIDSKTRKREEGLLSVLDAYFHVARECFWKTVEEAGSTTDWFNPVKERVLSAAIHDLPVSFSVERVGPDEFWTAPYARQLKPADTASLQEEMKQAIGVASAWLTMKFGLILEDPYFEGKFPIGFSEIQKQKLLVIPGITQMICETTLEKGIPALAGLKTLTTAKEAKGSPRELVLP